VLGTVRPLRLFLASLVVPGLILPLASYLWMRFHSSFLLVSTGEGPTDYSEVLAWATAGLASIVVYGIPASTLFLVFRRRTWGFRNAQILLGVLVYLVAVGVWLEVHRV